jgi:hypothetical protein
LPSNINQTQENGLEELYINNLKNVCPEISAKQCDFYAEGCAVALEAQGPLPLVELVVDGDFLKKYSLLWDTPESKRGWREPKDLAHYGALAIAFHIATSLTEYQVVDQARSDGGGFDYYLCFKEGDPRYNPDNFMNARLEISGINNGDFKALTKRVREKLEQTNPSDSWNIPAYVIVTEFSKPIVYIKKK